MEELKGVNVPGPIVPFTDLDKYPTHNAEYGKGGYRSVKTIAERDAIPADRKTDGMIVRVQTDKKEYVWENNAWAIWKPASVDVPTKLSQLTEDDTSKHFSKTEEDKLAGIAANANNYAHPANHPATIITEDASHRFMTDVERAKLTGIADNANNYVHPATHPASIIIEEANKKFMTDAERAKLAGIASGANDYVHPTTHPADIITDTATKVVMTKAERDKLAGIATGATKVVVDAALDQNSTNPIQNKAVALANVKLGSDIVANAGKIGEINTKLTPIDAAWKAKNTANGLVQLDARGKILANNLPGEFNDNFDILQSWVTTNPTTGLIVGQKFYILSTKKIFTATSATAGTVTDVDAGGANVLFLTKVAGNGATANTVYYWDGTTMVELPTGSDLQLGETATTAYQGSKGKQLYDDYEVGKNGENAKKARDFFGKVANTNTERTISHISVSDEAAQSVELSYAGRTFAGELYASPIIIKGATEAKAGVMTADMFKTLQELEETTFPLVVNGTVGGGGVFETGSSTKLATALSATRKGVNVLAQCKVTAAGIAGTINAGNAAFTPTVDITQNSTVAVTFAYGTLSVTKSFAYTFKLKKYWGTSNKAVLTNADVLAMTGSTWADSRMMNSTNFDCTGGKYPYYIIPTPLYAGLECWVGGLKNTDLVVTAMQVTNASGNVSSFTVVRLANIQSGILPIQFK